MTVIEIGGLIVVVAFGLPVRTRRNNTRAPEMLPCDLDAAAM